MTTTKTPRSRFGARRRGTPEVEKGTKVPREPLLSESNADRPISERNAQRVVALLGTYPEREQLVIRALLASVRDAVADLRTTREALDMLMRLLAALEEMHEKLGLGGKGTHEDPIQLFNCVAHFWYQKGRADGSGRTMQEVLAERREAPQQTFPWLGTPPGGKPS